MEPSSQTAAAAGILGIVFLAAYFVVAIISLVCFIKVLIALFKKEGAGLGIVGIITCGIYPFIWGWIKSTELSLKKTMVWWTICVVASIVLWFVAIAGMMGVAASDPAFKKEFQKEFQKALEEGQKKAREAQEEASQPANQN